MHRMSTRTDEDFLLCGFRPLHKGCWIVFDVGIVAQVRVLKRAGLPAREEDAQQMINMLDKDHDGVISYQEFCRFSCLLPSAQVSPTPCLKRVKKFITPCRECSKGC